jgi:hypothetical protein
MMITTTLEEIDRVQRRYSVTVTLQYFEGLTTVADDLSWGSDSDSNDDYIVPPPTNKKSRSDVKFINSLLEVVALTWEFHVIDHNKTPWCTCPGLRALQPF